MQWGAKQKESSSATPAGLAGWLLARLGRISRKERLQPRLELIERISLAPRQSLALIEVEGRRFLVACAADSTPAFFPVGASTARPAPRMARVSW